MKSTVKLLGAMAFGAAIMLFLLPKRETAVQPQPEVAASDLATPTEASLEAITEPVAVAQATVAPEPTAEVEINSGQLRFQITKLTMAPARPMPSRPKHPTQLPQSHSRIDADN